MSGEEQEGQRDTRTDCNLFGVGYDWQEERCRTCSRVNECMVQSEHERNQIKAEIQPRIPKAPPSPKGIHRPSPNNSPFMSSRPTSTSDEIILNIRFKKSWLRKILGTEYDERNAKGLNAQFIFKLREQVRKRFANRPEILAELDELFGGF